MRGKRSRSRGSTRTFPAIILLLILITAAGLIGATPLALNLFPGQTNRWERLSFIGQTYGAASALLSVLALIGVSATLLYQARETKVSREEARRAAVSELLKMAMEDPDYNECWGPTGLDEPFKAQRQHMYINMILSEWQMSYETKTLGEKRLRAIAEEMFSGHVGRKFWEQTRELRMATSQNRKAQRFHQVLDEAYLRTKSVPLPYDRMGGLKGHSPVRRSIRLTMSAGAGISLLVALRYLRKRKHS